MAMDRPDGGGLQWQGLNDWMNTEHDMKRHVIFILTGLKSIHFEIGSRYRYGSIEGVLETNSNGLHTAHLIG